MSVGLWGAEGRYVYVVLTEDLSDRIYAGLNASYVGMQETFEAKPDCRIVRVDRRGTWRRRGFVAGKLLDRTCQSFSNALQSLDVLSMKGLGIWWISVCGC